MEAGTNLRSWQQAFEEYPLATTRAVEKQLRASVTHDREKLRGLVGGNYRELLATAEEIVSLNVCTSDAESQISEIGQKCKPPPDASIPVGSNPRKHIVGQLRFLQKCSSAANAALGRGDSLQCAQLIVVSRLLVKSLTELEVSLKSVEPMRNRVASMRRRLLRYVDIKLSQPDTEAARTTEAVCAYCLVTSASASDAVKHIQNLRLEKLRTTLGRAHLSHQRICESLRYQISTLQTLKGLSGRVINDAVGVLQRRPILEDQALRQLESLDLEGTRKLIPSEILSFTPYFKRNPYTSAEILSVLEAWSVEASQVLSTGLDSHLEEQDSVSDILALRENLYRSLLPVYFTTAGHKTIQKTLHHMLSFHIEKICAKQVGKLGDLAGKLINYGLNPTSTSSLWQEEIAKMDITHGAAGFLQRLQNRRLGISGMLATTARSLRSWIAMIKNTLDQFEELRNTRWRDVIEEPEDEQEGEAATMMQILTLDEPKLYSSRMKVLLKTALSEFEDTLRMSASKCVDQGGDTDVAIKLLRSIRISVTPLQHAFPTEATFHKLDNAVTGLYDLVAAEVLARLVAAETQSQISRPKPVFSLPENLPSPQAFSVLRRLAHIMSDVGGTDLWSTVAVIAVKKAVAERVFHAEHKCSYVQTDFDESYLSAALGKPVSTEARETTALQATAAVEYWMRTKLLFGVLA